jgi:hypothetical protein
MPNNRWMIRKRLTNAFTATVITFVVLGIGLAAYMLVLRMMAMVPMIRAEFMDIRELEEAGQQTAGFIASLIAITVMAFVIAFIQPPNKT